MYPKALLLNASYEPLRAIGWQRAMILVYQGKVEVVEQHTIEVHSPSRAFRLPSIVRLHDFVKTHFRHEVRFSRENIFARDRFICQYDGRRHPREQLTLDHVIPRHKGGRTDWDNIVTCCIPCNRRKGSKLPSQIGFRLLRQPNRPSWQFSLRQVLGVRDVPPSWREYLYPIADSDDQDEEEARVAG
ncbi:MAG: HNH endonuclease [Candidatus Wallbacteria bacterium]|nr:HNH endonuclease [Candidatus Wallbacteria bacterium]